MQMAQGLDPPHRRPAEKCPPHDLAPAHALFALDLRFQGKSPSEAMDAWASMAGALTRHGLANDGRRDRPKGARDMAQSL